MEAARPLPRLHGAARPRQGERADDLRRAHAPLRLSARVWRLQQTTCVRRALRRVAGMISLLLDVCLDICRTRTGCSHREVVLSDPRSPLRQREGKDRDIVGRELNCSTLLVELEIRELLAAIPHVHVYVNALAGELH